MYSGAYPTLYNADSDIQLTDLWGSPPDSPHLGQTLRAPTEFFHALEPP